MNYIARLLQLIKLSELRLGRMPFTPDSLGAIQEKMVNLQRQDGYVIIYSDHYEIEAAFFREWILANND